MSIDIDDETFESSSELSLRSFRIFVVTAIVLFSTYVTSCNWHASLVAIDLLDAYHLRDNTTADKREQTNVYSAVGFFTLGGFGVLALVVPGLSPRRNWSLFLGLIIAYLLWCGFATLYSDDFSLAFRKYTILVLVTVGAIGITGFLRLEELIWVAILSTSVLIGAGFIAELSLGTFRPGHSEYRFSGLVHTNSQSFFGAVLCIAAFCIRPHRLSWQMVGWGFLAIGIGCILLSKSRSAMAGLVICSVLSALLATSGWRKWGILGIGGTVVCSAGFVLSTVGSSATRNVFGIAAMGRGEHTESLTGRIPLWNELVVAIAERPFFGYGYGSFWTSERVRYYSEMFAWEIPSGHSIYIDSVLHLGTIGAGIFFSMLLTGLAIAVIRYNRLPAPVRLFPIAIIVFAFVHGFTESQFSHSGFGGFWLFVCLLALATQESLDEVDTDERVIYPRLPR